MLEDENLAGKKSVSKENLGFGADFGVFGSTDCSDSSVVSSSSSVVSGADGAVEGGVGRVFVVMKRGNAKSCAEYRRMGKYFKSVERYRLERERRRRVLQLHWQGKSLREIALELGVSERTVKRDFAKVKPYYDGQLRRFLDEMAAEQHREVLKMLDGLSLSKRLEFITKLLRVRKQSRRNRRRSGDACMSLTVDVDAALKGAAALSCDPVSLSLDGRPLRIDIQLKINDKVLNLGNLSLSHK